MIQLEPPKSFISYLGIDAQTVSEDMNIFSTSSGSYTRYNEYKKSLSEKEFLGALSFANVPTLQEFIVHNGVSVANTNYDPTGTPVNEYGDTGLGSPAIADINTALDIVWQLQTILNVPPLVLLINPTSMSISYDKIQQLQDRTRYGYVFQAWGEEQPKISISAVCGAFITQGKGVQYASKRDSASWQNFQNLFHIFKSGGYIYDTIGRSHAHLHIGGISIHYDGIVYTGHIESFNFAYSEDKQNGGMDFSIEFVANSIYDTTQPIASIGPMRSPLGNAFFTSNDIYSGAGLGNSTSLSSPITGYNRNSQQTESPSLVGNAGSSILPPSEGGFGVSLEEMNIVDQVEPNEAQIFGT
jgi:hypothetical protein